MASSAGSFANCSVAAVKGQELCQRKLLRLLATISSNERNKKQTFKSSEFVLVRHPLLKTGRKSYSILFYLFLLRLLFFNYCFLLLVDFVLFSTMLRLRFLSVANTRKPVSKETVVLRRRGKADVWLAIGTPRSILCLNAGSYIDPLWKQF